MSAVETTRESGDRYTAVHATTGASGEGETEARALEALAEKLRTTDVSDPQATFERVNASVRRRVLYRGAKEDIAENGIEWAQSQ